MIDSYTHLRMTDHNPIGDLQSQMSVAGVDRALIVETWGKDNSNCIEHLIAFPSPQFRVAVCFRPEEADFHQRALESKTVIGLRIQTEDICKLQNLINVLESSGKWLLTHAEAGIGMLRAELLPLATSHPDLHIYIPHLAWPRCDKRDDKDWDEAISQLSRLPNIIVGVSAISHFSNEPYPHKDIEPFAERLISTFGANAIVIGSDYPMLEQNTYVRCIQLAKQWVQKSDACDFDSIWRHTGIDT